MDLLSFSYLLNSIEAQFDIDIGNIKKAYIGKGGKLSNFMKEMAKLSAKERKVAGIALNNLTRKIQDK
jgi:phenylalanyl-tRNA synthetase alpha subunit